jgi:hypothetical protein
VRKDDSDEILLEHKETYDMNDDEKKERFGGSQAALDPTPNNNLSLAAERIQRRKFLSRFKNLTQRASYYGVCPECGKNDAFISVGPAHFMLCHKHEAFWKLGEHLFPGHLVQSAEERDRNARLLSRYKKVQADFGSEAA